MRPIPALPEYGSRHRARAGPGIPGRGTTELENGRRDGHSRQRPRTSVSSTRLSRVVPSLRSPFPPLPARNRALREPDPRRRCTRRRRGAGGFSLRAARHRHARPAGRFQAVALPDRTQRLHRPDAPPGARRRGVRSTPTASRPPRSSASSGRRRPTTPRSRRRRTFKHLRQALTDLPDSQAEILVLRELEGLSYDDIGMRMKISVSAVESLLFRARRGLRAEYGRSPRASAAAACVR